MINSSRSWCPDRVLPQARRYTAESLGVKFAEGVILNLEEMWKESTPRVPMVCFLSMGSDPTNSIDTLARKHDLSERLPFCVFFYISTLTTLLYSIWVGVYGARPGGACKTTDKPVPRTGMIQVALEYSAVCVMRTTQMQGGWAMLQNTHLGLDFLVELLTTVHDTENVHESFRLWLTTEVHLKYPINLLQASIKYSFEPPQGVKAGLKRTFTDISQEELEYSNLPQWKPLLYTVAFLHTTVQERRKFGPLGWNIPYEYNQGDLNASKQYVMNMLDDLDLKIVS